MLKKDEASIAEIAYSTGFSDQSYFTACFKRKFGMTPKNYRFRNEKHRVIELI